MRQMDRSEQIAFGNWLLEKHGVNHQVTGEEIAEFYVRENYEVKSHSQSKADEVILDEEKKDYQGEKENFTFPDDLDKEPVVVNAPAEEAPAEVAPTKTKKKKES